MSVLPLALAASLAMGPALQDTGAPGVKAIRAEAISAHIRFLSDDLLEGRATGSRGHAIAERYVATQFAAMGLEPAGTDGTFLQPVSMRATRIETADMTLEIRGGRPVELAPERDFVLLSGGEIADVDVQAPLVFAAFGVTAPEYHHDDLAGIDLRGKIAVVLFGAPLSGDPAYFPTTAHAWYTSIKEKAERLRARGAVGILTIRTPEAEEIVSWDKFLRQDRSFDHRFLLDEGRPVSWPAGMPVRGYVKGDAFDRILAAAGSKGRVADLVRLGASRKLRAFDLGLVAHVRARTRIQPVTSDNVVAVVRGADPARAREAVVFTAHLDHLGVGDPAGRDAIYNGALDNASGVAALLEVARAFAALPARPSRSVLFVAVTGEEDGLLGSEHFVRHPTVPRDALVADVNMDLLPWYPVSGFCARGAEHSSLGVNAREAAEALGFPLLPDGIPKQVLFVRSDQLSFIRAGIPALFAGGAYGDEAFVEYRRTRYHDPSDEWSPAYDYESMAKVARAAFLVGLSVASAPERPRWNDGDLFARLAEERRAAGR